MGSPDSGLKYEVGRDELKAGRTQKLRTSLFSGACATACGTPPPNSVSTNGDQAMLEWGLRLAIICARLACQPQFREL